MRLVRFLSSLIPSFLLFLAFLYFYVVIHEMTHRTIYDYFGIESRINVTFCRRLICGETDVTKFGEYVLNRLSDEDYRDLRLLQAQTEILGYQLLPLYFILVLILIVEVHNIKYEDKTSKR